MPSGQAPTWILGVDGLRRTEGFGHRYERSFDGDITLADERQAIVSCTTALTISLQCIDRHLQPPSVDHLPGEKGAALLCTNYVATSVVEPSLSAPAKVDVSDLDARPAKALFLHIVRLDRRDERYSFHEKDPEMASDGRSPMACYRFIKDRFPLLSGSIPGYYAVMRPLRAHADL